MKNFITSFFIISVHIAGPALYCLGLIHTFKKHSTSEGVVSIFVFPLAMYRGLEFWWHDDFRGVEWDSKLNHDLRNIIFMLKARQDPQTDKYQLSKDITDLSFQINKYPPDKKELLEKSFSNYLSYQVSVLNDLANSLEKYKHTGEFQFYKSDNSLQLENTLKSLDIQEELDLIYESIVEFDNMINDPSFKSDVNQNEFLDIQNNFLNLIKQHEKSSNEFHQLFFRKITIPKQE